MFKITLLPKNKEKYLKLYDETGQRLIKKTVKATGDKRPSGVFYKGRYFPYCKEENKYKESPQV